MKIKFNFRLLISCLLLLTITTSSVFAQSDDSVRIINVFNAYKAAILNDEAEEALQTIDSRTKNYYRDVLTDVKKADSAKLVAISLLDRITILGIRARATKEEVLNMQDVDAFLFAIKNGMVGKNSVVNNSVGEVIVEGSFARGELVALGKKTSIYFHFYKENNEWKLNLTELFNLGNMSMKKMFAESGKDENVFLLDLLGLMTNKEITGEIWKPIE